jgi:hypothetical protein
LKVVERSTEDESRHEEVGANAREKVAHIDLGVNIADIVSTFCTEILMVHTVR